MTGSGTFSSWPNLLSVTRLETPGAGYLITVAPGMGCDEQNGLPVSMGKMQRQPVRQGLPTPQLPPQVAKPLASLRNCRAETVPAQRTPMTSAVKNIDLIFLFMSLPSLFQELNGRATLLCRLGFYYPGTCLS